MIGFGVIMKYFAMPITTLLDIDFGFMVDMKHTDIGHIQRAMRGPDSKEYCKMLRNAFVFQALL